MRQLTSRLYTVQTLVPQGARVADIGTDHGHLPISLIKQSISPKVIACDIREKPLLSAKENVEKSGTAHIELRLGDGLDPVRPDEVDCIVIAGMGGEVIAGILDRADWVRDPRYTLLLQPMTSADVLRRFLCDNRFDIESERAVEDAGRLYTVIRAVYTGEEIPGDDLFYACGKLNPSDPTAARYIAKQRDIAKKCCDDLSGTGRDELLARYHDLATRICELLGEEHGA